MDSKYTTAFPSKIPSTKAEPSPLTPVTTPRIRPMAEDKDSYPYQPNVVKKEDNPFGTNLFAPQFEIPVMLHEPYSGSISPPIDGMAASRSPPLPPLEEDRPRKRPAPSSSRSASSASASSDTSSIRSLSFTQYREPTRVKSEDRSPSSTPSKKKQLLDLFEQTIKSENLEDDPEVIEKMENMKIINRTIPESVKTLRTYVETDGSIPLTTLKFADAGVGPFAVIHEDLPDEALQFLRDRSDITMQQLSQVAPVYVSKPSKTGSAEHSRLPIYRVPLDTLADAGVLLKKGVTSMDTLCFLFDDLERCFPVSVNGELKKFSKSIHLGIGKFTFSARYNGQRSKFVLVDAFPCGLAYVGNFEPYIGSLSYKLTMIRDKKAVNISATTIEKNSKETNVLREGLIDYVAEFQTFFRCLRSLIKKEDFSYASRLLDQPVLKECEEKLSAFHTQSQRIQSDLNSRIATLQHSSNQMQAALTDRNKRLIEALTLWVVYYRASYKDLPSSSKPALENAMKHPFTQEIYHKVASANLSSK